jgi:hypothetical protein
MPGHDASPFLLDRPFFRDSAPKPIPDAPLGSPGAIFLICNRAGLALSVPVDKPLRGDGGDIAAIAEISLY